MSCASKNPTVMNVYCTHTELTKSSSMLHLTIKKKITEVKMESKYTPTINQNCQAERFNWRKQYNTCLCGMCIDNSLFSSVKNPLV